jgi:hypothetical protein
MVEISTAVNSLYDLAMKITMVRTTASSTEPAVIRSFINDLFTITNDFHQWWPKPSVKGVLEPTVMNFL